ncbi:hypothetical protein AHAS_Ahas19G0326100 [Arachis hypogaea]
MPNLFLLVWFIPSFRVLSSKQSLQYKKIVCSKLKEATASSSVSKSAIGHLFTGMYKYNILILQVFLRSHT